MNAHSRRLTTQSLFGLAAVGAVFGPALAAPQSASAEAALETLQSEPVTDLGPVWTETYEESMARAARMPKVDFDRRQRNGSQGYWEVPSRDHPDVPRSGEHYVVNKWGDARMGIGFGRIVDVEGAWFFVYEDESLTSDRLEVVGYRNGLEVGRSEVFTEIAVEPRWFGMDLTAVDRIEILASPEWNGQGYFAMDDLTFRSYANTDDGPSERVVLDFDDLEYKTNLTGSGYGGLIWETGTGEFADEGTEVHAPLTQELAGSFGSDDEEAGQAIQGGSGTAPQLVQSFIGPTMGSSWPPDTCGAVGPDHFVAVVNTQIKAYRKSDGAQVFTQSLGNFFGFSNGDPRVTWDETSGRWIAITTNFNNRIGVAISNSADPTGSWVKTWFNPGQGTDTGKWPDYPTLGCNEDFITTCAYMVGGSNNMSIFAIDKAQLILGNLVVNAFRNVPWEGAIHGATTWDTGTPMYLVSRRSGGLRMRRLNLPANAPTLTELGTASVGVGSVPPNAPQLGSGNLDTLDGRLMNAMVINGMLYTCNTVGFGGKAGCRWYQVDVNTLAVPQAATLDDSSLYLFMPGIAANAQGDIVMGFSGSNNDQWAAAYFAGRRNTDAANQMSSHVLYKAGEGNWSRQRWGDYSLTSLDPEDSNTFWTIQEYAGPSNRWRTYIAELTHDGCGAIFNYCQTSTNSTGGASTIDYTGSTSFAANDFGVFSSGNPNNQFGVFFMGVNQIDIPFGNGRLCLSGQVTRFPLVQTDAFGIATYGVDNQSPPALGKIVPDSTWNWQFWFRDPMGGGAGFNTSNGLSVNYCP